MKTFLQKHKILMIALCAVLCLGILSGIAVSGVIRLSMRGSSFETVADAKKEQKQQPTGDNADNVPETAPKPTPTPAPESVKLTADEVKRITETVQQRRRTVIPVRSGILKQDNSFLWTESEPTQDQCDSSRMAAEYLTQILFGRSYIEVTGEDVNRAKVRIFTDPAGDRASFIRITDPNTTYILTIRESNQKLICADLLTYPENTPVDREKNSVLRSSRFGTKAECTTRACTCTARTKTNI